jgi:hypothetical protein
VWGLLHRDTAAVAVDIILTLLAEPTIKQIGEKLNFIASE